ncbi:iron-sulfur cluster repair di-iron protein [Ectobacillus polymachus]|uniref:iron-sulfur cluster repair di-iron protein n=1 Tax=Ectobacillus polymachus TaxID=1508806 RepID=UPI003A87DC96
MNFIIESSNKTGDIVTKLPAASKLFKQYKIDFCCGGDRPIGNVLEEKGLDKAYILQQLNDLYASNNERQEIDWETAPLHVIVDQIITHYHVFTTELLAELSPFVMKIYRVHGDTHVHLKEVYQLFSQLKAELEPHLIDEERDVFPHIVSYEKSGSQTDLAQAKQEIAKLESEHEAAGALLKKLRTVTNDYQLPEEACNTYRLTYLKLEELESMTFEHIHLENNILFPRLMRS